MSLICAWLPAGVAIDADVDRSLRPGHTVYEPSEATHLDNHFVARLEPWTIGSTVSNTFRRTCEYHVARIEGEMPTDEADKFSNAEDHVANARRLPNLAVYGAPDWHLIEVAGLVAADQPRTYRSELIK